jgi:hypothetical protein
MVHAAVLREPSRGAAGQEGNNGKGNEKAFGEHGEQYSVGVPA